jgi:RES domain-containing protein
MGSVKAAHEDRVRRGHAWPDGDTYVCSEHVDEPFLRLQIVNAVEPDSGCSYCSASSAAPMHVLVELIAGALHRLYERANDAGVPRDEGDWVFPVQHTGEVLEELCWAAGVSSQLAEDLTGLFAPEDWVEAHQPMERSPEMPLREGWVRFCEYVKYTSRYLLKPVESDGSEAWERWFSPDEMLEVIAELAAERVTVVPAGTVVFRARACDDPPSRELRRPKDFTSPPAGSATQGRMNPAGIVMFYGATDVETAATEVYNGLPQAQVLTFETTVELTIIDLTDVHDVSMFNRDLSHVDLAVARFMEGFVEDVAKPIVHDDRVHHEYVPTQVVTEYLRYRLDPEEGHIDGIQFQSSVRPDGTNLVLFVGQTGCMSDLELGDEEREEPQRLAWVGDEPATCSYEPPQARLAESL